MSQDRRRARRAFTLIELMIVVAIIGILAAIAIPKFASLIRKSHEGSTKGNLGALRSAITIYYGDMEGQYPGDNLSSLTVDGKYMAAIPMVRAPDYHDPSNAVVNPMGAAINFGDDAAGQWVYFGDPAGPCLGMSPRQARCVLGEVWVGCTHTDTKGSVWTTY